MSEAEKAFFQRYSRFLFNNAPSMRVCVELKGEITFFICFLYFGGEQSVLYSPDRDLSFELAY